jgi:hypothetical protein
MRLVCVSRDESEKSLLSLLLAHGEFFFECTRRAPRTPHHAERVAEK